MIYLRVRDLKPRPHWSRKGQLSLLGGLGSGAYTETRCCLTPHGVPIDAGVVIKQKKKEKKAAHIGLFTLLLLLIFFSFLFFFSGYTGKCKLQDHL